MTADKIVLVRHAKPTVLSDQPSNSWPIGSEGKEASKVLALFLSVDLGTTIWSSTETKAEETATEIAKTFRLEVQSDARLCEVRRPWTEDPQDYVEVATRFLAGEHIVDWEDRQAAQTRVSKAIEDLRESHDGEYLVAVTHGLVMTLYLESIGAIDPRSRKPVDPIEFWSSLGFPDAWRIDLPRGWLDRIGYTWDGTPISSEPPFGTAVIVYRYREDKIEFLLLHRAGQAESGDWAWTPPAGARMPGEDVISCAMRELKEEAGLDLPLVATELGEPNWPQFLAEAPELVEVVLSAEHDAWEWVEANEACDRCLPAVVSDSMRRALGFLEDHSNQGFSPFL